MRSGPSWAASPRDEVLHNLLVECSDGSEPMARHLDASGTNQVYVRALRGGEEWRTCDRGWGARWAADGKSVYYVNELSLMQVELELVIGPSTPSLTATQPTEILQSLSLAEEEEFAVDANGRVALLELAKWEELAIGCAS